MSETNKTTDGVKASKAAYEAKREKRYRTWMGIFYPDSMPEDYQEQLSELHLQIWVSPIHDKDSWTKRDQKMNPKHIEGTLKKPHYHYIVAYANPTGYSEFAENFSFLHGVIPPAQNARVKDLRSMVRYLTHKDDPKKAQYDAKDIQCFGGANLDCLSELGTGEKFREQKAMRKYIREHDIQYYSDFVDFCDDSMETWSYLLDTCCSYSIQAYFKGRAAKRKDISKGVCTAKPRLYSEDPCVGDGVSRTTTPTHGGCRIPNNETQGEVRIDDELLQAMERLEEEDRQREAQEKQRRLSKAASQAA